MRLSVTNTIQLLCERQWYCLLSYFKIFYEPYTAIDKMNKLIVVCITIAVIVLNCNLPSSMLVIPVVQIMCCIILMMLDIITFQVTKLVARTQLL